MSVVDNQADLDAARLRLGAEDEPKLVDELAYWSIAEIDHHKAMAELQDRYQAAVVLHAEAQRWGSLIALELCKRRDARLGKA